MLLQKISAPLFLAEVRNQSRVPTANVPKSNRIAKSISRRVKTLIGLLATVGRVLRIKLLARVLSTATRSTSILVRTVLALRKTGNAKGDKEVAEASKAVVEAEANREAEVEVNRAEAVEMVKMMKMINLLF